MRHRLAEPCHDRKLHSTDFIYSFDVGKTNQLLRKQNSDTEPQSHIAYSIVLSSVFSCCDLAGTFNVLTYTAATYHVADTFFRRVRITIQGYGLHSTCRWRWWDSTPDCLFPLRLMRYISVLRYLYMWLHFDIYIDVLCVPAYWSRDGTDTQRLDRLRSGRYMKAIGTTDMTQAWIQACCSRWNDKMRKINVSFAHRR